MKNGLEIDGCGDKRWYKDGKLHREGGPAVELASGTKRWYKDGLRHREDGPAIESTFGIKEWYKNGGYYREDDLPHYEGNNSDNRWFYKNKWYYNFQEYILAKVMG